MSLRRFILNALPSCLPISNNHSICASLRNCLMWILRRPILGLDYYSPFSPWSFPIQFITKILQVWLCRTQFHLHSLSQWFLTLAPLIFFLIEHQSPKWEQLRFSIQRRSKSKRRTWKLLSELNFSSCRRCFRQQTYLFVYISCTVHYWTLILSSATRPSIRIWQNLERN